MYRVGTVVAVSLLLSSLAVPSGAADPMGKDREGDKNPGQSIQQQGTQTPAARQEGEKNQGLSTQQQTSQASSGRQSLCQSQAPAKSEASREAQPAGTSGQQGQVLKGQFVRMEGENYVMQDQGKEVCIRTSYATFLDQTFVPGDIITVRLGSDGTAIVISRVLETQGQAQTAQGGGQPSDVPSGSSGSMKESGMSSNAPGQSSPQQPGMAAEGRSQQNAPTVQGELLTIQGEFYTLKDASGNEVRLHVNKDTKMDGSFQVGDKLEAERTTSGHAVSLRKAAEGKTGPGGASPSSR